MASSFVRNNTNNSTATANNNSNDTNSIGTSSVRYVGDINETSDTDSLSTNNSAKMKEQMERNKAFLIEKKNQKLREQQEQSQNNEQQQHDSMMKQDPYQWHEFLRETEMVRRANIQSKLQYNQMYRESLQQLLQDSMNETQTAYRLTMGLALAQQQLSDTLLSGCNSDDNSASNSKLNYYSKNKQKSDNDNVEQPPMMAIAVPENNDNTPNNMSDAVSVLEKEHSLIQHKVSRSVHHQQHAAKRIQELYERSSKYSKKLNDRAKQILNELQEAEDNVQQTWGKFL